MQGLAISDLSFCELATENYLDKIMGGQNYINVKMAVYVSNVRPRSILTLVQLSVNSSSPKPSIKPFSWKNIKFDKVVVKNIKLIKPVSGIKFQV